MSEHESVLVDDDTLDQMPIGEAVSSMVDRAVQMHASDLYFASDEDELKISVRHLGIVRQLASVNRNVGRRFIAHVKALAEMDVTEKRRPLDGRWIDKREDRRVDLRINTIPTLYGEDMTFRILERDTQLLNVDGLGLIRQQLNQLNAMLTSPGGLILVTGPTGSGKTTTLYAFLHKLNDGERKINTIEDPIEYSLLGVRQSQINERIGLDFPEMLRGVLRQAPDIIMIGEIRDAITAITAVRAANSGHLVFATLHSPNAASAVQSMLSLGVAPHFLASSIIGVVAQRLVRTLCPKCKVEIDISESPYSFDEVKAWVGPDQRQVIYGPKGCETCFFREYGGRVGVFEVLTASRKIRDLIAASRPAQEIARQAFDEGQVEFRRTALVKVAQGITSVEESIRAIPAEFLGPDEEDE